MSDDGNTSPRTVGGESTPSRKVVRVADEADRILNEEKEVRDFRQLPKGERWIVSRSIMGPVYVGAPITQTVQLSDKPQSVDFEIDARTAAIAQVLQPPNGTIKYHFQEDDPHLAFWRLMMTTKRLRNSLAFVAEIPIPLRHVVLSSDLMWRFNHDQDLQRYHPEIGSAIHDAKQLEEWYQHIDQSFSATTSLLSQLPPDSPLGRALALAGGAVWADDPEDGFLSAWRAVDVIAKIDYSDLRRPTEPAPDDTFDKADASWSDSKKIRESLSRRVPGIDVALVSQFNELRGRIAHDTVTAELYRGLYEQRWTAFDIASRAVRSRLQEQGLAVPTRSPPLHP
jgi:hypothetical protein